MQPRANFELIQTPDPEIFAIKISGHLTPRQRSVVEQLIEKCRQTGKQKVLFDFTDLESLGGGVAQILGEFATELDKAGSPPWFVGSRDIVRKFLTARFAESEPRFAASLDEACANLGGAGTKPATKKKTTANRAAAKKKATGKAKPASGDQKDEAEDFLEIVEAVNDTASAASVEPPSPPKKPAGLKTESVGYISLDEALAEFSGMNTLPEAEAVLTRLLNSTMLAHRSFLFLRNKNGFEHEKLHLAHDGIFATVIERRHGPSDLLDFVELDLADDEVEVLEQLNCQVCVPIFGPKQLEGICFVSKIRAGEEYSAAETFALEILSRQVTEALWSEQGAAPVVTNGGQARRNRSLQSVARQLHGSTDEETIISRLAHGLIGEMGISGVTALRLDDKGMRISGAWGQRAAGNSEWTSVPADAWDKVRAPGNLDQHSGDWAIALKDAGCSWFAPLSSAKIARRGLAFSLRNSENDSDLDREAIDAVVAQAGFALAHSDALEDARSQTLLVSKTLVTLIERRLGHEASPETDLVAEYVARLAERMNVERQELPDLLYGTIMRDIGMIEISDLVLKSPRKLTPEEWKLVQRHPIVGAEILQGMGFSERACDVVQHHHERFNGQGYPHALRGTAIPVGARMVSVVESFVAMLRETPYRPALSEPEALGVLQENWEMRYDPNVIEQFIALKQVEQSPLDIDKLLVGQTPG